MRNPLIKRIPKELASDWHKYLVIILFMVIMIGVEEVYKAAEEELNMQVASEIEEHVRAQ